ncbi:MAG: hypothetical protein R3297_07960 [Desulfobulbales bacterium]|nr:hypothetical protein [Desulfobulbales bacterium]
MAHRTELNALISNLTGISRHTIDRIGVNLNKSGLLHSGGRGRHAPDLGAEDLKNIIMALLGSDSTGNVFRTVLNLHALNAGDGTIFGDALLGICADQEKAGKVVQISVMRNYPQATIYWKDESGARIGKIQDFKSSSDQEQPGMRIIATLSGGVLRDLVKAISGIESAAGSSSPL